MTHTRLYLLRMPLLFLTFQDKISKGFEQGYLLPAEVTACSASPWDYPLDHQGHMTLRLHSGVAAYSSYIGLELTRIVYPQQEDLDIKIDQYSYFDIIGTVPPLIHHGIWGCLCHDLE